MSQIEEALDGLMQAIKSSREFNRYQRAKGQLKLFPELEQEVMEFCRKNYELQNSQGTVDLYEETDRMEQEYCEFRKNPLVAEYLASELALCRIVQQINWTLVEGLDFQAGLEE